MNPADFDQLVDAAFRRIPARFRKRMTNVALMERSFFTPMSVPDRITIFQGPHERLARNPEHLTSMIEDTVWHEVGHYFGMNEAQVRAAQRRRKRPAK